MHVSAIIDAITKVNAEYGDRLCVYAIQIGYTSLGKELSEKIVQNVRGGYKSTLKPEAQTILKRNIQILKDNPKAKVRIAGYTSASGTDDYNQKLSERRANAVQEYLVKEGFITRDRLFAIGYGETNPLMYEESPKEVFSAAAKANMRVLFEIFLQ